LIATFSNDAIAKLESLPERVRVEIGKALDRDRKGQKYEAEIMLTFEGPKAGDEIAKEYEKLEAWVSSGHIQ